MVESTTVVFIQMYEEPAERLHQELLLKNVVKYYTVTDGGRNLAKIIPVIERTSEVSLRLLDWFIVSYAKENDITYLWQGKAFNVFSNYRQQLNHYSKRYFDAFRRHTRTFIIYESYDHPVVETTLGQLIFFRWCLENGIIEYVEKNENVLTEHMKSSIKSGLGIVHLQRKDDKHMLVPPKGDLGTLSTDGTAVKTEDTATTTTATTTTTTSTVKKRAKSAPKQEHPSRAFSATRYFDSSYTLDFS